MHFKLIIAFIEDDKSDVVMTAARKAGATGATIINNARGEGMEDKKTFLGLTLDSQRDVMMFLVEEHLSRHVLETIAQVGEFEQNPGAGIALQVDVEDAVGITQHINALKEKVEEEL